MSSPFFPSTFPHMSASDGKQALETPCAFTFDRVPAAWDTFLFWGYDDTSTVYPHYHFDRHSKRGCRGAGAEEPRAREVGRAIPRATGAICRPEERLLRKGVRTGRGLLQLHDGPHLRAAVRGDQPP